MGNVRTDLALEAQELWQENAKEQTEIQGVVAREFEENGVLIHRVEIKDEAGAAALGKPVGRYSTVQFSTVPQRSAEEFAHAIDTLARELSPLLPKGSGCVMTVGLGNRNITPDAIGDKSMEHVLVTRHLVREVPDYFSAFRPVAAITPGVLGMTGVESREIIKSVAEEISPDCILVIDALASRRISRLCKTVQITDTGIVPGSGVGNARAAITSESMGFPVIAIGVPTVVDINTVLYDLAETAQVTLPTLSETLMVTPKEIDTLVAEISRIIGYAINRVLQPTLSLEELDVFLS
ncbi:MAG: GPR endopeptidase [Oscillospiraceae bacterium]|nr:GPR endopeptidase [Oscillospiraceae bacterium]